MTATTRLQQHTEVLSHILSFTDRQSLIPCLRVSTQFHAIGSLHIDKIYKHIYIGRNTITSVFEGIKWEDLEYKWTDDAERARKTRGQNAIKKTAVQAFSYVALFEGISWDDMDEGWKTRKESRKSPPSPPNQPSSKRTPPVYGTTQSQRHDWKVYALAKCTNLTMCDTWTTSGLDTRHHTHNLLHNGKAHQLFPLVETVRIIPLASAHKQVTPLCSAHGSCPFIQEISPKKLVHRNSTANGFALTDEPVDELILFFPDGQ